MTANPARHLWPWVLRLFGILGVVSLGLVGVASPAVASPRRPLASDAAIPAASRFNGNNVSPCSSMTSITSCVLNILAPGGGTDGVYLKQVGGPVLASSNATFPYEPGSSIKPVIALYAMEQVEQGHARLTDEVPMINGSGGPGDCPTSSFTGTEPLGTAIQQMLQVSDNNRTLELMEHFGVDNLNAFAASLGLSSTMFQTSSSPPGFNILGCLSYGFSPLPTTVDGNTMSLTDATTLWSDIASLPAPYTDALYQLAAGRDMFNSQGYDFTGLWPNLLSIAGDELTGTLSNAQVQSFVSHMSVSVKGGSYDVVSGGQEADWWVFAGVAQIPSCVGTTVKHTNYVWGYFVDDAVGTQASSPDQSASGMAFFNASGQLLAAPIAQALSTWKQCAPRVLAKLHASGPKKMTTGPNVGIATTLATVADKDSTDIEQDVLGTIFWGDGSSSFATLTGGNGTFTVHGWHSYASPGRYKASIVVKDVGSGKVSKHSIRITVS